MANGRKRDKVKQWLSVLFSPQDEICDLPGAPAGFMSHSQGFAVHNSPMTAVHGNQYTYNNTTYMQGDRDIVPQIMSLLSQHIIHGAAHDDSAREPPPRCHPDTRVKLIARITAWFDGQAQQELLLWITGPAGVGKSAVVQTFAEYLVKSKSLGASVFISRPNRRNKPQGIFITIAYQLATRIKDYRNFIVEQLSLDPSLLYKGIEAQFKAFIVEPFVEQKIGAGSKRWGILLDGLDELKGDDAQCKIIELISSFVQEHRNTPLVWIIASRPESHISSTFEDDEVRRSCWKEFIPIDSTEACEDVERYLRSRFQTIRKQFRDAVPSDWPSDGDFLELAVAATGLFVYAEVVMEFLRDTGYADPVSRFEVLLSVIARSNATPTQENPFVHLDALYHEILSSIPPALWPTAKQMLAFTFHSQQISTSGYWTPPRSFQTLRGMSLLFGIPRNVIYACLNKCRSTLKIPDWKAAHKQNLTFLHASFADYLKDSSRSGDFYIGDSDTIKKQVILRVLEVWNDCCGDDLAPASVESMWNQYCSKWDENSKTPSRADAKFNVSLLPDIADYIGGAMKDILEMKLSTYVQLRQVHMIKLCKYSHPHGIFFFLHALVNEFFRSPLAFSPPPEMEDLYHLGFAQLISLGDLELGHLDYNEMSPARAKIRWFFKKATLFFDRPRSGAQLKTFMSELKSLQECSPELEVVIVGTLKKGRVAVFRHILSKGNDLQEDFMYYAIPYHE